jgi:hypothetical protein
MANMVSGLLAAVLGSIGLGACGMDAQDESPGADVGVVSGAINPVCNGGSINMLSIGDDWQSVTFEGDCFNGGDVVSVALIDEDKCGQDLDGVIGKMEVIAGPDVAVAPGYVTGTFSPACSCHGKAYLIAGDRDAGLAVRSPTFRLCAF